MSGCLQDCNVRILRQLCEIGDFESEKPSFIVSSSPRSGGSWCLRTLEKPGARNFDKSSFKIFTNSSNELQVSEDCKAIFQEAFGENAEFQETVEIFQPYNLSLFTPSNSIWPAPSKFVSRTTGTAPCRRHSSNFRRMMANRTLGAECFL